MEIYHLKYPDHLTVPEEEYALAIGFFDGLHRGHQAVIEEAVSIAKKRGLTSAVMTFDPHPRHLFNKEQRQLPYITTFEEKVKQLRKMGVDAVFFVTFDWELAALQPSAFIDTFIRRMNVRHVVAGFDFTFGAKGEGTMHDMERLSEGQYETTTIEKVSCDGEKVSSTRIRQAVHDGDMMLAKALLGRFYKVKGTVVSGAARGRTIGFPTANIEVEPSVVLPSKGVYAVLFKVDGATYKGVCNVGVAAWLAALGCPGASGPQVLAHRHLRGGRCLGDQVRGACAALGWRHPAAAHGSRHPRTGASARRPADPQCHGRGRRLCHAQP